MAQHVTDESHWLLSCFRQAGRPGVSLEAQAEKIRAMALVDGAELIDIIVDGGEPRCRRLFLSYRSAPVQGSLQPVQ